MNAKELRLGNAVFNTTENKVQIVNLFILDSIVKGNQSYQPIPLTEEILLKAGFANNDNEKFDPSDEYAEQFEYILKSGISYRDFICRPSKGWFVSIGDYNNENIKFEYLHHLQNIIFDLTGEEIKL